MSEFAIREICNEEYPPKNNLGSGIIYCDYIPMGLTPNIYRKSIKEKKSVDMLERFEKHG